MPDKTAATVAEWREAICKCLNKIGRHACDHKAERLAAAFGEPPTDRDRKVLAP